MIIYSITNTATGKRYIGMTEMALADRWSCHKKSCRRGVETALYSAIRKYGEDTFVIAEVAALLPEMARSDMATIERVVIAQEGTLAPGGYNMTAGGDGIQRGFKHTAPSKCKGRPWPESRRRNVEEYRAKQRAVWAAAPERKNAASVRMSARNSQVNEKRSANNV